MTARRVLGLRALLPLATAGGCLLGGVLAYLAGGTWLLALAGAVAGSALASLLLAQAIRGTVRGTMRGLRDLALGDSPPALAPGPIAELTELTKTLQETTSAIAHLDVTALQDRTRLLAALNSTADAVMGVDRRGDVCFANLGAQRLFFRRREELEGRPFSLVVGNAGVAEALAYSRDHGVSQVRLLERPGRRFIQVGTAPIVGGGEWAALAVFHDISDVKRSEQMRRDFVANVSHELRTPLSSIRAVLETLEAGALSDEAVAREFVARAQTEVERLTQMVSELMELARIEAGDLPLPREPFDAGATVAMAVERMRPQASRLDVRLTSEVEGPLPAVGDAPRLERAIVNLVQNALKFTPSGGEVSVLARATDGLITIEVADTGVGIDERDLGRVFERFYKADNSRRSEGTGLGLALVKHTAEAHGGAVAVESSLGRGSRFTVTIPAARTAVGDVVAAASPGG